MRLPRKVWIFLSCLLIGMSIILVPAAYSAWKRPPYFSVKQLTRQIAVTEQIRLDALDSIKHQGFETIIDLRPDGEAPDQVPSEEVAHAAKERGIRFVYVPVPHGAIPEAAVTELGKALSSAPGSTLLYCRSGRRAARTWSLVEASRVDGMQAEQILAAVRASGQSADDLKESIAQRIDGRTK
jgi:uncharacterized protein (TIGR01244 family)